MKMSFILPLLFSVGCTSTNLQGIKGQVFWVSGNQMPGPNVSKTPPKGVQREIHIYELTTTKQVELTTKGFFKNFSTELIMTITTKQDGSFKVKLPAGSYSVFVKESEGLYANLFDENNAINPVHVVSKEYVWLPITVNYQAAY